MITTGLLVKRLNQRSTIHFLLINSANLSWLQDTLFETQWFTLYCLSINGYVVGQIDLKLVKTKKVAHSSVTDMHSRNYPYYRVGFNI